MPAKMNVFIDVIGFVKLILVEKFFVVQDGAIQKNRVDAKSLKVILL